MFSLVLLVTPALVLSPCTSSCVARSRSGARHSLVVAGPPRGFVDASHILLRSEDSDAEAEALLARIQSGEISFGDAAAEFSACPSRGKQGSLSTFSSLSSILFLPFEGKRDDVAAFDTLVMSPETELNTPYKVKTAFGTHLVMVEARG